MDMSGPVRESKRDLISVETLKAASVPDHGGDAGGSSGRLQRFLRIATQGSPKAVIAVSVAVIALILGLMIALIVVCEKYRRVVPAPAAETGEEGAADVCLTPGCIGKVFTQTPPPWSE
jgi:hypothetical protein